VKTGLMEGRRLGRKLDNSRPKPGWMEGSLEGGRGSLRPVVPLEREEDCGLVININSITFYVSGFRTGCFASMTSVDAWLLRTVCCVHSGINLSLVLPSNTR